MNRVRHFAHALIGLILIAGIGALLSRPSVVTGMRHHSSEKIAVAGALIVLALFVLVSVVRAVAPPKPQGRSGLSYAAPARRK